MSGNEVDLVALLRELRQAGAEGRPDAGSTARFGRLICDRVGCATLSTAYEHLYARWQTLPEQTLTSGMFAGNLLFLVPMLQSGGPCVAPHQREELVLAAVAHGPEDSRWQAGVLVATGGSALGGLVKAEPALREKALARLEEARGLLPPDDPALVAVGAFHALLRAQLSTLGSGADDLDSAADDLAQLCESPQLTGDERAALSGHLAGIRAQQAARREDEPGLRKAAHELDSVLCQLPKDHGDRAYFSAFTDTVRNHLVLLETRRAGRLPGADESARLATTIAEVRRAAAQLPEDARSHHLGLVGMTRLGAALLGQDAKGTAEGLDLLEDALDLVDLDDERWLRYASSVGTGRVALSGLPGLPPAQGTRAHHLDQGISWLTHTWRLAAGPEHPLWAGIGATLAAAYRARGNWSHDARVAGRNHAEARRVGLDALGGTTWSVLLQSGTPHAADVGGRAAEHALDVARWCLADGEYEDAARALDAGRGLLLHAATVMTTVPEMLASLGHTALAEEWRAAGPVPPDPGATTMPLAPGGVEFPGPSSRLRRRVLDALDDSPYRQLLLETPRPDAIGAALRAMGATALVYLVPEGEGVGGCALIVSAEGSVRPVPLNGLTANAAPVTEYRAAGPPGRDMGPVPTDSAEAASAASRTRAALERLCDWAGETVMSRLLVELPRGLGRVPSIVLVPVGALGAVPWQAARTTGPRGPRYACQDAQISLIPSAKLLCEVASRRAAPASYRQPSLVVGNPTGNLIYAGEEARAIHRVFYPEGVLLDGSDGSVATPSEIRRWLRRQRDGMLHLACHGVVRQGERHSSYLALTGGYLTAEELTEGTGRSLELDLVVLAACSTNVSGRGYDEAYSLATAFLSSGARSVLGSLWTVPDEATSLLMYMAHHYLHRAGLSPGPALRRAQLWMLDDRREVPAGMPAKLAGRVPFIDREDVTGWAGFTHLGW
ncbi:CHAT domain-containing protein [Streptomyces sp. NPDC088182]|uniref:CHAT domain-containing protein n=1 Tax=Streptomyces sp. NPDC088182 TaxID=3365838 RepID=UPI00383031CC